jgi:hypothetical protein
VTSGEVQLFLATVRIALFVSFAVYIPAVTTAGRSHTRRRTVKLMVLQPFHVPCARTNYEKPSIGVSSFSISMVQEQTLCLLPFHTGFLLSLFFDSEIETCSSKRRLIFGLFAHLAVLVLIGCFASSATATMNMETVRRNGSDLHNVSEGSGHHYEKT